MNLKWDLDSIGSVERALTWRRDGMKAYSLREVAAQRSLTNQSGTYLSLENVRHIRGLYFESMVDQFFSSLYFNIARALE
jgi:hypothetical protein